MTKKSPSRLYRDRNGLGPRHARHPEQEQTVPRAVRRNQWRAVNPGRLHRDLKRLHQDLRRTAP